MVVEHRKKGIPVKKQISSRQIISITVLIVLLIAMIIAAYWLKWDWTGIPTKNLWDWFNLLGVLAIPVVAGLGVAWYTAKQTQVSEVANEQQHKTELEVAEQRHQAELKIVEDNQREAALQSYIDKMSELLLANNLCRSAETDEVRVVGRVRTLTVLRRLDPVRKASILQFLCESGLIDSDGCIIDLSGADLSAADLNHASLYRTVWYEGAEEPDAIDINLNNVNLRGANLRGANLNHAHLVHADLRDADLHYAFIDTDQLFGADLSGANMHHALVFPPILKHSPREQFRDVKLEGATMPDGTVHPKKEEYTGE